MSKILIRFYQVAAAALPRLGAVGRYTYVSLNIRHL